LAGLIGGNRHSTFGLAVSVLTQDLPGFGPGAFPWEGTLGPPKSFYNGKPGCIGTRNYPGTGLILGVLWRLFLEPKIR